MVGGPYPPIGMSDKVEEGSYDLLREREAAAVHAWGIDDHVKSGCEEMQWACGNDVCFQMDFPCEHHMLGKNVGTKDLCDLIMAAWYASRGSHGRGKREKY